MIYLLNLKQFHKFISGAFHSAFVFASLVFATRMRTPCTSCTRWSHTLMSPPSRDSRRKMLKRRPIKIIWQSTLLTTSINFVLTLFSYLIHLKSSRSTWCQDQCDQKKIAKCLEKLPKNDFTRKMKDFDTYTSLYKICRGMEEIWAN